MPLFRLSDGHLRFLFLCCRRKNPEDPYNRYLVAVYKCQEGFTLQDSAVDRLYCSEDKWVGEQPACVATSINRLHLTSIFCFTLCVSCSTDFLWSILFYTMMNPDFHVAGLLQGYEGHRPVPLFVALESRSSNTCWNPIHPDS